MHVSRHQGMINSTYLKAQRSLTVCSSPLYVGQFCPKWKPYLKESQNQHKQMYAGIVCLKSYLHKVCVHMHKNKYANLSKQINQGHQLADWRDLCPQMRYFGLTNANVSQNADSARKLYTLYVCSTQFMMQPVSQLFCRAQNQNQPDPSCMSAIKRPLCGTYESDYCCLLYHG